MMELKTFIFLGMLLPVVNSNATEKNDTLVLEKPLDAESAHLIGHPKTQKLKLLHAEPLYVDLIRDLGARKGEKEWNMAFGITDNQRYDSYSALVEYEWAPVDRLGVEIETPFTFYYTNRMNGDSVNAPRSRLNGLKLAAQYTILVSEKAKTSIALGYLHEFEMPEFRLYGKQKLWKGNLYNPFMVAARRWGSNFHSLIYTGPVIEQSFSHRTQTSFQLNSSVHYLIANTRNFIGVEFNKDWRKRDFDMVVRPQMRVSIADNLLVGIVAGIPVKRETQRFSSFLRLIYEPGHKIRHS